MTDITTLGLDDLLQGLKEKKFSSRELTQSYIDRINKHKELNSFISVAEEEALKDADLADTQRAKGVEKPLLGIPIAVKDLILTKGLRTTAASKILSDFIAPYDATVVTKLKEAGAHILGKTNLDEFAMGASNETSAFG
ncbi:MAG: Asp-tRNA(Asn)/Glu-tRNA(Gln) amidotransferase GatCAB subunit A, partial [SAR324 cluster bacterium]|nr:Asp-tRNA(Asn)/Glu-tRNA(Gln) amidotransferase GatCAB subunit A [SAR324 cluster bacterium]